MDDLIARLEAATAPDRELDWAIVEAIGKADFYRRYAKDPLKYEGLVPAYTASIDAALTLVPEGCGFVVMGKAAKIGRKVATAPTPALAICIAALRARKATND